MYYMHKKEQSGWVKIHRKMRDNPYMKKPAYRSVWIELLFEAEHGMKLVNKEWVKKDEKEMKSIIFKGERIYLKPGQLTCGAKQLSEWTGVPRGTVERILKTFKNEGMIEVQTSNEFSLVQIINWESYQSNEEQVEERVRNQRGTSEERVRTPKEWKNEKNEKSVVREKTQEAQSVAQPPTHKGMTFNDFSNSVAKKDEMFVFLQGRYLIQRPDLDLHAVGNEFSKFCEYWSEKSPNGKKERWEKEPVFDVSRRLTTWFSKVKITQEYKDEMERSKVQRMQEYYSNLQHNENN